MYIEGIGEITKEEWDEFLKLHGKRRKPYEYKIGDCVFAKLVCGTRIGKITGEVDEISWSIEGKETFKSDVVRLATKAEMSAKKEVK